MTPEQRASIDDFRARWPIQKIRDMTLEEYTRVGSKDSFTFWLEGRTDQVGSIWGGSSFKFGVYERKNLNDSFKADATYSLNDKYGWYAYLGETPEQVFVKIKEYLLSVVDSVARKDLKAIEAVQFSPSIQWKVAFLYQDFSSPCVLPIYHLPALRYLASGDSNSKATVAECQEKLIREMPKGTHPVDQMYELWPKWEKTLENVTGLMASDGNPEWKDAVIEALKTKDHAIIWWSKRPSKGEPVLKQLRERLTENGAFPFYFTTAGKVNYRCRVVAFSIADEYHEHGPMWVGADGYEESFDDYEDGKKSARIVFLVDDFEKLEQSIPTSDFTFWNGLSSPTQDNLQAYVSMNPRIASEVADVAPNLPSKNVIFYGPPGTGKTFLVQNGLFAQFTINSFAKPKDRWLVDQIETMPWWKVVAAVLAAGGPASVPSIADHEFIQAKCATTNQANPRAMIWAMLQQHTVMDCDLVKYSKRTEPLLFRKKADSVWQVEVASLNELIPEVRQFVDKAEKYRGDSTASERNYEFITFHQSMSYEDFIEGIKPTLEYEDDSDLAYKLKDGIFKILCQKAKNNPERQYALFIDEINRGNIPAIFGELISLIEDDKREGEPNALSAQLPYSKQPFSVPPNLYLIGTMNTADRSVEGLDAALRRRFSFVALMPDPSTLSTNCEGINLQELLTRINQRLERLLDLDHTIGHAFLWDVKGLEDLKNRFSTKVIPQLQEYFYGDWRKIGMVLGDSFVQKVVLPANGKFWPSTFPDDESEAKTEVYRIRPVEDWTVEAFQSVYIA